MTASIDHVDDASTVRCAAGEVRTLSTVDRPADFGQIGTRRRHRERVS